MSLLGNGSTAYVYTTDNENTILKIFSDQRFYEYELNIMLELANKDEKFTKCFIKLLGHDDKNKALILKPNANVLSYPYDRDTILKMLTCIKDLRHCQIVHRDLSPRHFLS